MSWWRRLWCKHSWEVRTRIVQRGCGIERVKSIKGGSPGEAERFVHGCIRAVCTCSLCGAVDVRFVTGHVLIEDQ